MTTLKFRKKPVVIEAKRFTEPDAEFWSELVDWGCEYAFSTGRPKRGFEIRTLEGWLHVSPGDWIIKGVAGEFYPIKDEIFGETYEAVDVPTSVSDGS